MLTSAPLLLGLILSSSWWGGKSPDEAAAIARDEAGNIYVAGTTQSDELKESGGGFALRPAKPVFPGDVFVQKMSPDGGLVWRSILGGSFTDRAAAIAIDKAGAVYLAGTTYSLDFPVSPSTFRKSSGNPRAMAADAFLVKIAPDGSRLVYSTYYGGAESDLANALAVDDQGQAVVAGETYSDDLPVTPGVLTGKHCSGLGYDGFVAKFNAEGTGLVYGTYLCGSGHDHPRAVALDLHGAVYVSGETASRDFPVTKGAFRETLTSTNFDIFAVKLSPDGKALEWGTFYGGNETERLGAMAVDSAGRILVAGETRSSDLPGAPMLPAGMQDAFFARIAADGKSVDWVKLFGGTREDHVAAITPSPGGGAWVAGWTRSPEWPGEPFGSEDGFLAYFPPPGEDPPQYTRIGGRARDRVTAMALGDAVLAVAGSTEAAEWIGDGSSPGEGQGDAFLLLADASAPAVSALPSTESRAQRPGGPSPLWSDASRVPYSPLAPVSSGERWLVELRDPPAAGEVFRWRGLRSAARDSELVAARQRVRSRQSLARSDIERIGGRVYGSTDLVANILFVEAAPKIAQALTGIQTVKRILPVRRVRPELDATGSTHLVPQAFQRIGGEANAGAGVRLGIIDSGVLASHPAFSGVDLPPVEGFPRANRAADLANTNSKVIVARGYMPAGDAPHANDDVGHGTGVAAVAGGGRAETLLGPVHGVAPAAYIGNYKVLTNETSEISGDDAIILALEDAAADGMNVVNLSLHTNRMQLRPEDDIYSDICERMAAMGVMVIRSTGNEGPEWSTLTNPHLGEWGILVGSHLNARTLGVTVELADGAKFFSIPSSNADMAAAGTISGRLAEVQQIAPGTWGCSPLPADSLKGRIALIDRGSCTFSVKGENARKAGAVAMIVMALAEAPAPFIMSMGSETLPSFMVSYGDGQALRQRVAGGAVAEAKIPLMWQSRDSSPDAVAASSSSGPGFSTIGIKPDLIATGDSVWSARTSGAWGLMSGTSFAAPHVSGAMAVVVGQRPGLDPRHYRSLIINTATPVTGADNKTLPIMKQGAGRLNLDAALASTVAVYPTSLHLGSSRGDFNIERPFKLINLDQAAAACRITPESREGAAPIVEPEQVEIPSSGEAWVILKWTGAGWKPGQYDGHLRVRCDGAEYPLSIPYWHGVSTGTIASIKVVQSIGSGKIGQPLYWAAQFRLVDEAGLPVDGAKPVATVKSGAGSVIEVVSQSSVYPGIYALHVRPAAGQTVFQIAVGGLTREITVSGE